MTIANTVARFNYETDYSTHQAADLTHMRTIFHQAAQDIALRLPNNREAALAFTNLEQAAMWANKAVVADHAENDTAESANEPANGPGPYNDPEFDDFTNNYARTTTQQHRANQHAEQNPGSYNDQRNLIPAIAAEYERRQAANPSMDDLVAKKRQERADTNAEPVQQDADTHRKKALDQAYAAWINDNDDDRDHYQVIDDFNATYQPTRTPLPGEDHTQHVHRAAGTYDDGGPVTGHSPAADLIADINQQITDDRKAQAAENSAAAAENFFTTLDQRSNNPNYIHQVRYITAEAEAKQERERAQRAAEYAAEREAKQAEQAKESERMADAWADAWDQIAQEYQEQREQDAASRKNIQDAADKHRPGLTDLFNAITDTLSTTNDWEAETDHDQGPIQYIPSKWHEWTKRAANPTAETLNTLAAAATDWLAELTDQDDDQDDDDAYCCDDCEAAEAAEHETATNAYEAWLQGNQDDDCEHCDGECEWNETGDQDSTPDFYTTLTDQIEAIQNQAEQRATNYHPGGLLTTFGTRR